MINSTFFRKCELCNDQNILGKVEKLEQYSRRFGVTDFAKLLGVDLYLIPNNGANKNLWTTKKMQDGLTIWSNYDVSSPKDKYGYLGEIPIFNYTDLKDEVINLKEENGIKEFVYGEYPQWVVDEELSNELEELCRNGSLIITDKNYTYDSAVVLEEKENNSDFYIDIKSRKYVEYEHNGQKYVRIKGRKVFEGLTLSDGRTIKNKKTYWIKVEPIIWLSDSKDYIAIPKYTLYSKVTYCFLMDGCDSYGGSDSKKLIDAFSKEIECVEAEKEKIKKLTKKITI
jgi:hypothetical protein